jgi:hypothetical protein
MTVPGFGDRVHVRDTIEMRESGLANRVGVVYGFSIPSSSGVGPVPGDRGEDRALSISFEETGETLWMAPHLVDFVDHYEGLTMTVGERSFVRDADGQFHETTDDNEQK